jgi:predicted polyphosphate/ATP-dependent NAD kinase
MNAQEPSGIAAAGSSEPEELKKLGLIVNPVAGLGGRVGLKGSDGAEIQKRARELGAVPQAQNRAIEALQQLRSLEALEIITYPGEMGEDAVRACGFAPTACRVVGAITPGGTTAGDTRHAAREMQRLGVDLLLFAGGDGTARDIYEAVGLDLPVLGIPAGVKIHSAVYATHPRSAGDLAALYLQGRVAGLREAEVMDIDEEAFRQNALSVRLYGYLRIPFRMSLVQSQKMPSAGEGAALAAIAEDVADKMEPGILYIIGPGTTTRAIADELGLAKTLLGVDVVLNRTLIARDANEAQLLAVLDAHDESQARIVVTPIGGQGYIFGRGNQQISPRVIERVGRDQIMVVSTPDKLYALGTQPLRVDTGDLDVDRMLSGYLMVVTGYNERAVRKVTF